MSGFLSGLLTAVAVVATVVSGGTLGIVAGALIAASYAASKGWIGGSVGKFFNSSTGHYLTMAVGLAAGASSILSDGAAVTATSASATTASANAAAEGATQAGVDAVGTSANTALAADQADTAMAAGGSGAIGGATQAANVAAPGLGGVVSDAVATPSGTMALAGNSDTSAYISSMQSGDPSITSASGLQPQEIQAAQKAADQTAQQLGFAGSGSNVATGEVPNASQSLGLNQTNQATGQALTNAQAATAGNGTDVTSANAGQDLTPVDMSQAKGQAAVNAAHGEANIANIDSTPTAQPGMLSKAGGFLKDNPAAAIAGGSALSGLAQGVSAQKTMQEQIAAQQWGNMQWQNPTQVAQLNAQAAQPINVPVGYLNRAAAVRNMMNGSTGQTAPLQSPQGMAPVGMSSGTVAPVGMGSGPIPPTGMPATPRGGM